MSHRHSLRHRTNSAPLTSLEAERGWVLVSGVYVRDTLVSHCTQWTDLETAIAHAERHGLRYAEFFETTGGVFQVRQGSTVLFSVTPRRDDAFISAFK